MVREDIVGGLRNGLERGVSLEEAKQSLINAGYSSEEVEEASNYLSSGSVFMPRKMVREEPTEHHIRRVQQPSSEKIEQPSREEAPGFFAGNWKIIVLLVVLFFLIILFVLTLLFRDKIMNLFS